MEVFPAKKRHQKQPSSSKQPPDAQHDAWERRMWIGNKTKGEETIRVMSYNVLADGLMKTHRKELYPDLPGYLLEWKERIKKIVEEIKRWKPDVINMQEVDRYEEIRSKLNNFGFEGCYLCRTGDKKDGCATFWNTRKIKAVHRQSLRFRKEGLNDNVAILNVFETKASRKRLVNGNVHVLFNPQRGEVKLGQLVCLFNTLEGLQSKYNAHGVVVAGDFNLGPESPLYEFVVEGKLDCVMHDRRHMSGQVVGQQRAKNLIARFQAEENLVRSESSASERSIAHSSLSGSEATGESKSFAQLGWDEERLQVAIGDATSFGETVAEHNLGLKSAYASFAEEPQYTSLHNRFMGTLDYIFHTERLVPKRVLAVPDLNHLGPSHTRRPMLPSKHFPSDHISLVAEFVFAAKSAASVPETDQ